VSSWLSVAIGGGIFTPPAAVIAILFTRRKINAESSEIGAKATEVANRAAGIALDNLRKELQAESRRRDEAVQSMDIEYRRRLDAVQETEQRDRTIHRLALLIDAHTRWDKLVVGILRDHGIEGIPDPPTLDHEHFA
jgi:hypothetical protein